MEIPKAFAIGYLVPLHLRGRSLKSSKNQKGRPQTKRFFWYNSNLCHTQRLPHWTVQPGDLQHPGDRCFVSSNSAFQRPIHDAGSCGKHHEIGQKWLGMWSSKLNLKCYNLTTHTPVPAVLDLPGSLPPRNKWQKKKLIKIW